MTPISKANSLTPRDATTARQLAFEISAIVLIAFNQSLSLLPDTAPAYRLFWQTAFTSIVYLAMWIINRKWLMPKMMAKNRFVAYLLVLIILLIFAELITTAFTVSIFRVLTGASLTIICFVGLSASRLMKAWSDICEREAQIQQQLLDQQVDSQRLKIDSKMMLSELDRIQGLCSTAPDTAVDAIYNLSRNLRSQLYEK